MSYRPGYAEMSDASRSGPQKNWDDIPPLNFVHAGFPLWPELSEPDLPTIAPDRLAELCQGNRNSWLLRTYYELRRQGVAATHATQLDRGAINFVAPRDFGRRQRRLDAFIVIARGDAHLPMLANYVVEQNQQNGAQRARGSIPFWPQPGIIPRDPSRGSSIAKVGFKGRLINIDASVQSEAFQSELRKRGVELELDAFEGLVGKHNWNDYRSTDLVMGLRNLTHYDAGKKPASKLVNAWFAEVPALLGPEPAYGELRRSELDYIEVKGPNDVLQALDALQASPDRYQAMIENGKERRRGFTEEALVKRWVELLRDHIVPAFERWRRRPLPVRAAESLFGILAEGVSVRRDRHLCFSGDRILDTSG